MEAKYINVCEATKKDIRHSKFLVDLEVVPNIDQSQAFYCDTKTLHTKSFDGHIKEMGLKDIPLLLKG